MTKEQVDRFLRGPHLARVATVKPDGTPFVVPVWFEWDGKDLFVVGRYRSGWVEYVKNNPAVAVVIDEAKIPLRKVIIEGTAEIVGSDWTAIGKRMAVRYLGPRIGPRYLKDTLDQPRYVIKITSKRMTTWYVPRKFAGGKEAWHYRYYVPGTKWFDEHQKEQAKVRKGRPLPVSSGIPRYSNSETRNSWPLSVGERRHSHE